MQLDVLIALKKKLAGSFRENYYGMTVNKRNIRMLQVFDFLQQIFVKPSNLVGYNSFRLSLPWT